MRKANNLTKPYRTRQAYLRERRRIFQGTEANISENENEDAKKKRKRKKKKQRRIKAKTQKNASAMGQYAKACRL